jgi:hypothetical protein
MISIAISVEAFEATTRTLPLGSVGYGAEANKRGERLIWLEEHDGESARRDARTERELQRRDHPAGAAGTRVTEPVVTRKPRPIFYSSLGECVMLNTAWIDRPVDTRGLHSPLPRPP